LCVAFEFFGHYQGTLAEAIVNGFLNATVGSLTDWIGTDLLAFLYPQLNKGILRLGIYGDI